MPRELFIEAVVLVGVLMAVVSFGIWGLTSDEEQILPSRREALEMALSIAYGLAVAALFYWAVMVTPVHELVGLAPLCK